MNMKTSSNQINNQDSKKSKRKAYEYLILLLLTISLFITATYAWFTDSAYSKGNKIFSGNLYIDIIVDEDTLLKNHESDYQKWIEDDENKTKTFDDYISEELKYESYIRKYADGTSDTFYYVTDEDEASCNLYNIEPGQANFLNVKYLNTGDLAFRAAGALKIDVDDNGNKNSYTGLDTLNQQFGVAQGALYIAGTYYSEVNGFGGKVSVTASIDENGNLTDDIVVDVSKETPGIGQSAGHKFAEHYNNAGNINESWDIQTGASVTSNALKAALQDIINQASNSADSGSINTADVYSNEYSVLIDETSNAYIDPQKISEGKDALGNDYSYYRISNGEMNYEEYEYRFNKLIDMQGIELDGSSSTYNHVKKLNGSHEASDYQNYYDKGGHLEDILEVYVGVDEKTNREVYENKDKTDNLYYFGTISQFECLVENGPNAQKGYKLDEGTTLEMIENKINNGEEVDIEAKYMYLYNDESKSLYDDYKRYLSYAGGHYLPIDVIKDNSGNVLKDGVNVTVYDGSDTETLENVKEYGETSFLIYMPKDVDSSYQNASISLSLGATATQVEYEMDDTGCMVYDKAKLYTPKPKKADVLKIYLPEIKGNENYIYTRVIDINDNVATLMAFDAQIDLGAFYFDKDSAKIAEFKNDSTTYEGIQYEDSVMDQIASVMYYLLKSSACTASDYRDLFSKIGVFLGDEEIEDFDLEAINKMSDEELLDFIDEMDMSDLFYGISAPNLAKAVVPMTFNQKMYEIGTNLEGSYVDKDLCDYVLECKKLNGEKTDRLEYVGLKEIAKADTITRNCRILTIEDVYNCLGVDTISNEDLVKFIYGNKEDAWGNTFADAIYRQAKIIKAQGEGAKTFNYPCLASTEEGVLVKYNPIVSVDSEDDINEFAIVFSIDLDKFDDYEIYNSWPAETDFGGGNIDPDPVNPEIVDFTNPRIQVYYPTESTVNAYAYKLNPLIKNKMKDTLDQYSLSYNEDYLFYPYTNNSDSNLDSYLNNYPSHAINYTSSVIVVDENLLGTNIASINAKVKDVNSKKPFVLIGNDYFRVSGVDLPESCFEEPMFFIGHSFEAYASKATADFARLLQEYPSEKDQNVNVYILSNTDDNYGVAIMNGILKEIGDGSKIKTEFPKIHYSPVPVDGSDSTNTVKEFVRILVENEKAYPGSCQVPLYIFTTNNNIVNQIVKEFRSKTITDLFKASGYDISSNTYIYALDHKGDSYSFIDDSNSLKSLRSELSGIKFLNYYTIDFDAITSELCTSLVSIYNNSGNYYNNYKIEIKSFNVFGESEDTE